jgi:hypothetical protein
MTTPSAPPARPPAAPSSTETPGSKKGGRGKPREIQTLPADEFQVFKPRGIEQKAKYRRKRVERSDQQKAVDKLVLTAYQDWLKAKKPTKFVDQEITVWPVSKRYADDCQFMLRKGATLIERQLRFGDCPEVRDGNRVKVELSFYVTDRHVDIEGAPAEAEPDVEEEEEDE